MEILVQLFIVGFFAVYFSVLVALIVAPLLKSVTLGRSSRFSPNREKSPETKHPEHIAGDIRGLNRS